MKQIAVGTRPDQMGLSGNQVRTLRSKIKKAGIEFPFDATEWFATRTERKMLHLLDLGNNSYEQLAEGAEVELTTARAHISGLRKNLRKAGMNTPIKIRRRTNISI